MVKALTNIGDKDGIIKTIKKANRAPGTKVQQLPMAMDEKADEQNETQEPGEVSVQELQKLKQEVTDTKILKTKKIKPISVPSKKKIEIKKIEREDKEEKKSLPPVEQSVQTKNQIISSKQIKPKLDIQSLISKAVTHANNIPVVNPLKSLSMSMGSIGG